MPGKATNYEDSYHLKNNLKSNYEFIKYMIKEGTADILITGTCLEYGKYNGKLYSNQKTFPKSHTLKPGYTEKKSSEFK